MPKNPIIEPTDDSFVPVPPDISLTEGATPEEAIVEISNIVQTLARKINGLLSLGTAANGTRAGNLRAQYHEIQFTTADEEVIVPHGLGRVPVGYKVVRRDRACSVYDTNESAWTEDRFSLLCDTTNALVTVELF